MGQDWTLGAKGPCEYCGKPGRVILHPAQVALLGASEAEPTCLCRDCEEDAKHAAREV